TALAVPAIGQQTLPPQQLPTLMEPRSIMSLPQARPAKLISYGEHPSQVVELFLPAKRGEGPLPVVLLIHGGCFASDLPGREIMRAAAGAFAGKGWAVWSIGYRRVDEEGGGYPGTFLDAATAIDLMREHADEHGLDLRRVAAFGHSAGGTLALWAAGRPNLPNGSPMWRADPLPLRAAVSVGGFGDLRTFAPAIALACGNELLPALLRGREQAMPEELPADEDADGASGLSEEMDEESAIPVADGEGEGDQIPPAIPGGRADIFADTSPASLLPTRIPVVLLHGVYDHVAFPAIGLFHAQSARRRGDRVELFVAPNAGHFETIAPGHRAFEQALGVLERFLQ
ncbi:MAG: alpha/beta fold hydrolase, partial [Thermaurantiacus sp.]